MAIQEKYKYKYITKKVKDNLHLKYNISRNGCWNWLRYTDCDGYAQIILRDYNGKRNICRAHRVSWMIHHQCDWPANKPVARHTCHNPSCINPLHIIPGTEKENTQDCILAGRFSKVVGCNKPVITPLGKFKSVGDAATAMNIHRVTILRRIKRKTKGYKYV